MGKIIVFNQNSFTNIDEMISVKIKMKVLISRLVSIPSKDMVMVEVKMTKRWWWSHLVDGEVGLLGQLVHLLPAQVVLHLRDQQDKNDENQTIFERNDQCNCQKMINIRQF